MKISEIETIVRLMSENNLTEFKIEASDYNLCIRRGSDLPMQIQTVAMPQVASATVAPPVQSAPDQSVPSKPALPVVPEKKIESPIVGTFYRSSSPEAEPFVKVGDKVTADTVVCIVEAMKVMNEVKAEQCGTIKEILVENASPVEYGQTLFIIE
ncbi:MAG: acetyl-CoA carboxylase biotin carboxyl carrier protein [Victivallaceae bacterium]|nr:acetyl-CoA carboxylase biotin carboxyl carrier protein [Victivallaceae bacterium]